MVCWPSVGLRAHRGWGAVVVTAWQGASLGGKLRAGDARHIWWRALLKARPPNPSCFARQESSVLQSCMRGISLCRSTVYGRSLGALFEMCTSFLLCIHDLVNECLSKNVCVIVDVNKVIKTKHFLIKSSLQYKSFHLKNIHISCSSSE